jgi:hypothetical protein
MHIANVLRLTSLSLVFLQLIQEEMHSKGVEIPESNFEAEENDNTKKEEDD